MRLVYHYQIPICLLQFCLYVFVTRELMQAGNTQRHLAKRVARYRGFQTIVGQYIKSHLKFATQFILLLLDKVARGNNQTAAQISPNHQFLNQ
jgi:hypothetical protein